MNMKFELQYSPIGVENYKIFLSPRVQVSYSREVNTSKDRDETALALDDNYYILNGDHRQQIEQRLNAPDGNVHDVVAYYNYQFNHHRELIGFWTEEPETLMETFAGIMEDDDER